MDLHNRKFIAADNRHSRYHKLISPFATFCQLRTILYPVTRQQSQEKSPSNPTISNHLTLQPFNSSNNFENGTHQGICSPLLRESPTWYVHIFIYNPSLLITRFWCLLAHYLHLPLPNQFNYLYDHSHILTSLHRYPSSRRCRSPRKIWRQAK